MPDKIVTVFIPTYNGERYLQESIEAILNQEMPDGYALELLVIDSGSTDATLAILKRYESAIRLVEIPNREFSHGGTRDRAARLASGEFVLFLSQDATPAHRRWLINMIEPFFLSERIGCVYGGQQPRDDAPPTIRREVTTAFGGRNDQIVVSRARSLVDGRSEAAPNVFFSDVNSAARTALLCGEVPFRHVDYSEDQALAQDMLDHGYLKAFAYGGLVWHSNDYSAREYYGRKRDEHVGLVASTGTPLVDSRVSLLLGWIKPTLRDVAFVAADRKRPWGEKVRALLSTPAYNLAAKGARHQAARSTAPARAGEDGAVPRSGA